MLRAVIGTSSLVSYTLTRGEIMRRVIAQWRAEDFTLISSPAALQELAAVLAQPAIQELSTADLEEFVRGIERFTLHVPGKVRIGGVCRDLMYEVFLAATVEGSAAYLVSSDRDLLGLRRYQDNAILNPGQFLIALELHTLAAEDIATKYDRSTLVKIKVGLPLDPEAEEHLIAAIGE